MQTIGMLLKLQLYLRSIPNLINLKRQLNKCIALPNYKLSDFANHGQVDVDEQIITGAVIISWFKLAAV